MLKHQGTETNPNNKREKFEYLEGGTTTSQTINLVIQISTKTRLIIRLMKKVEKFSSLQDKSKLPTKFYSLIKCHCRRILLKKIILVNLPINLIC